MKRFFKIATQLQTKAESSTSCPIHQPTAKPLATFGYLIPLQFHPIPVTSRCVAIMFCYPDTYPLVNIQKDIERGPVEIVDLPSYKMVDLSSSFCKRLTDIWVCLKIVYP